jgi:hypothetical protein
MSAVNFSPEIKQIVDSILLKMPSVVPGKMFGYPAYYVHGKLSACIFEKGVGIKVPENLAKKLIGKEGIIPFQPLGRPKMKEWIQINRQNPEEYLKDKDIFEASVNFTASAVKKKQN